ncbi:MAG: hypothetical protein KDK91_32975 [Gammaproteobacteria bacterium]|nr:hypothetical protein [Gammaproteobacteria bacterium]
MRVVLYLRNPVDYMRSFLRQAIKKRGFRGRQSDFVSKSASRMAYSRLISRWSSHFPLVLRCYDEVKSDLVVDFLSILGVTVEVHTPRATSVNSTPPDGVTAAMYLANRWLPAGVARRVRRVVASHARLFAPLKLDDAAIIRIAREVPAGWDMTLLQSWLTQAQMALLLRDTCLDPTLPPEDEKEEALVRGPGRV